MTAREAREKALNFLDEVDQDQIMTFNIELDLQVSGGHTNFLYYYKLSPRVIKNLEDLGFKISPVSCGFNESAYKIEY